jgi:hypothetical protein
MGLLNFFRVWGHRAEPTPPRLEPSAVRGVIILSAPKIPPRPKVSARPKEDDLPHILEKLQIRSKRHAELEGLITEEKDLPPEVRSTLDGLRNAAFGSIEADDNQRKFRTAFYLYQSAIHTAKRKM